MNSLIHLSRKKVAKNPRLRWEGLNEFLSFTEMATLSPTQRIAALAYGYSSRIELAGHHDYFSAPPKFNHSEVVSALRTIGALEQASILTTALEAVHAASARAPQDYSNRFAAGVEFADLAEFDDAFEACTRSVPHSLMGYMGQHESEFIEWSP